VNQPAEAIEPAVAMLARLAAVGAHLERRDNRLVLRAGPRPVPRSLFEATRRAKPALLRLLSEESEPFELPYTDLINCRLV
jgi:hypothetical protein